MYYMFELGHLRLSGTPFSVQLNNNAAKKIPFAYAILPAT